MPSKGTHEPATPRALEDVATRVVDFAFLAVEWSIASVDWDLDGFVAVVVGHGDGWMKLW